MNHTPEPWELSENGLSIFGPPPDEWGITWLHLYSGGGISDEEQRANARRIVACVNACKGISTEELERRS
jgi:hypothetical protein